MKSQEKQNILTIILFVIYILLLVGIILFKLPFYSAEISTGERIINLIPLQGSFDDNGVLVWREIFDNILLFVPLGIYISVIKNKWSTAKKLLLIMGLTVAFEVTQFIFALGVSDVTDLLSNTLGGLIGLGIYALLFKIFKNKTALIVNILALIVTICVLGLFGKLFYLNHFVMQRRLMM